MKPKRGNGWRDAEKRRSRGIVHEPVVIVPTEWANFLDTMQLSEAHALELLERKTEQDLVSCLASWIRQHARHRFVPIRALRCLGLWEGM